LSPPDPPALPRRAPLPPDLASALALAEPRLGPFSRDVHWYAEVSSTNDVAAVLAEDGALEGAVVGAETQRAGRGRQRRVWHSPPGAGLYVSVLLRPAPHAMALLTLAAGVAIAEGVRAATGLETMLKWPNDVFVGSAAGWRKLAGILAETGSSERAGAHVILGIGINVRPGAYPPEVAGRAASLEGELGRAVDRGAVLAECLAAFAARYDDLQRGAGDRVLAAWRALAAPLLGRGVEWGENGKALRGTAENVDANGALMVRTDAGIVKVVSGEVRWM
jgi:BirA family transcriptional regulator, biotin operon repressor / biotin---[acetyl-CoA-carboxylase] ligase